jgi:hypothetical protein
MRRARKIFASNGGEVANELLSALDRGGLVADFVDAYVAENDRRALKCDPGGYRELEATIGREALLAMVAQVTSQLPRFLTPRRPAVLRGPEAQAAEAFGAELFAALGRAQDWSEDDAAGFRKDLDLYQHLAMPAARGTGRRKTPDAARGPFVDRCALLLDPSMMEKARRAAAKFSVELERTASKMLTNLFRRRS